MARNMSFAMTTEQIIDQSKTVTRRFGWKFLKPGEIVNGVKKSMGLKKGEKIHRLGKIEIISTDFEPLNSITKDDCIKEGFPEMEPAEFVAMIQDVYKCKADAMINRIEFKYLDKPVWSGVDLAQPNPELLGLR